MKKVLAPLCAATLCLPLLIGCSSKKTIVGRWQGEKGEQIEFTRDGKTIITLNATYTLPDDGHYKLEADLGDGKKESETVAYTLNGDTLTIQEGPAKRTFKRTN